MTIATSDSGGGAGIQADLKAFARCGVHGTSAIVALTAQNTHEVISVETLPRQFILDQVRAVATDMGVDAVKIGMLFDEPTIAAVDEALELVGEAPVVLDPVMVAESGAVLLMPEAKQALIERIVPRATVVTPNLAEARELTGLGPDSSPEDLARAVRALGPDVAVVTGGHLDDGADRFFDGQELAEIEGPTAPRGRVPRLGVHALLGAGGPSRPRRHSDRGGPKSTCDSRRGGGQRPPRDRLRGWAGRRSGHNRLMKLLRMTPGKGDVLLAEGDPEVAEDEERLIEEFRRQLDLGMWAAVPHEGPGGRREATMVRDFSEVPAAAERVIFFPRAAGG